jgi:TonB-linked SusC/RagA family outer membrane protein
MQLADSRPSFFELSYPSGRRVDARSSDMLRARIAVDLHDESIAAAVDAIASSAGIVINYSSDVLPHGNRVSLVAREISLEGALSVILLDTRLDVQLTGNQLTLVPRGKKVQANAHQPGPRITGLVVDATNRTPLDAAAVLITGTTVGMSTTDSGTFTVRVPPDARSLTVRRIGYVAQTVAITAGQTEYVIALQRDVLHLEAQVVTGVATTISSQSAANDVAVVDAVALDRTPSPTIENGIQGKIPGATISQQNGGAPGGGLQVQIRGITSINATAAPLYVVDGVLVNNETLENGINAIEATGSTVGNGGYAGPYFQDLSSNRIADLNPEDIETIEVLKGASASAIYGAKASSGVIVITTKRGTAGKPRWTFSQKVGHFSRSNSLDIRTFPNLASAEAWGTAFSYAPAFVAANYAGPQDYQAQLFGNSQASYETDLSVSGTLNQTQYFVSALSKYDNGALINSGYNKQSARTNVTQQFVDAVSATVNLSYTHSLTRRGFTGNDNVGGSPYTVFTYTPQFVNLDHQNADGTWAHNPFGPANPFADAVEMQTPGEIQRFIGGGNIDWTAFNSDRQSLKLRFIGGADLTSQRDQLYAPPTLQVEQSVPTGLPGVATLQEVQTTFLNYSINVIHHYNLPSVFDAVTSIGFVRERRENNGTDAVGQNLLTGVNAPTAGTVTSVYYSHDAARDQSLYAQEQILTLRDRLALTAGLTAERTTNDGNINKFYFFPRYSASYRVPLLPGFLDEVKLRAAYGQAGTEPTYGVRYTPFNTQLVSGANGIAPNELQGNSRIRPEAETEIEIGFDATLFRSRAQLSLTAYQKRIQNLLLQALVAPSETFNSVWFNGGEFTNQGIELSLTAAPVQTRDGFNWVTTASFYRNYSVVNSIPVPPFEAGVPIFDALFGGAYIQPGRSVSEVVNPGALGANGVPIQFGDFQPSFTASLSEELTFKSLHLYGLLDWRRGGTVLNLTNFLFDFGGPRLLQDTALQTTRTNKYLAGNYAAYGEPATFVKLRELTLSYTLPSRWIDLVSGHRVASARLSLTGRNLLAWYPYTGLDPEVSLFGSANIMTSVDVTPYPPSRSYFLSLDLGL